MSNLTVRPVLGSVFIRRGDICVSVTEKELCDLGRKLMPGLVITDLNSSITIEDVADIEKIRTEIETIRRINAKRRKRDRRT